MTLLERILSAILYPLAWLLGWALVGWAAVGAALEGWL